MDLWNHLSRHALVNVSRNQHTRQNAIFIVSVAHLYNLPIYHMYWFLVQWKRGETDIIKTNKMNIILFVSVMDSVRKFKHGTRYRCEWWIKLNIIEVPQYPHNLYLTQTTYKRATNYFHLNDMIASSNILADSNNTSEIKLCLWNYLQVVRDIALLCD